MRAVGGGGGVDTTYYDEGGSTQWPWWTVPIGEPLTPKFDQATLAFLKADMPQRA